MSNVPLASAENAQMPLGKLFAAALAAVRAAPALQLRDEDRLQLFALHKQAGCWLRDRDAFRLYALRERASKGEAPVRISRVEACQENGASVAIERLSPEQAMAGYCKLADALLPDWRKATPAFLARERGVRRIDLPSHAGLGLELCHDVRGLRVTSVRADGVVGMWNAAHPESQLRAGDLILAVNGQFVEAREHLGSYAVDGRLSMHFRRGDGNDDVVRAAKEAPPLAKKAELMSASGHRQARRWHCFNSAQLCEA